MAKRLPKDITIIRDTREKENQGWIFNDTESKAGKINFSDTELCKLDSGDYSIKGMEDIVTIERKNGFSELFGNMTSKSNKERFHREMERMKNVKHKYIVVEGNINKDILGMCPPQMRNGPPAKTILKWLNEIELKYGVNVIFAGDCGKIVAESIFENILRIYSYE